MARQHENFNKVQSYKRYHQKQQKSKFYENDYYQKELLCNAASLKTFLGKTHPCEKP
jgi:hypothetical protein